MGVVRADALGRLVAHGMMQALILVIVTQGKETMSLAFRATGGCESMLRSMVKAQIPDSWPSPFATMEALKYQITVTGEVARRDIIRGWPAVVLAHTRIANPANPKVVLMGKRVKNGEQTSSATATATLELIINNHIHVPEQATPSTPVATQPLDDDIEEQQLDEVDENMALAELAQMHMETGGHKFNLAELARRLVRPGGNAETLRKRLYKMPRLRDQIRMFAAKCGASVPRGSKSSDGTIEAEARRPPSKRCEECDELLSSPAPREGGRIICDRCFEE